MSFEKTIHKAYRKARKVSRIIFWNVIRNFKSTLTTKTKQGVFTVLTGDNYLGKSLFCFDQHEMIWMDQAVSFLRSIKKCPPEGQGTFVDIGANNGCTSVGMLLVNKLEKSIAIEPDPKNFQLLRHNVEQNHLSDRVICLPLAVSSAEGELQLELSNVNYGDHRIRMTIAGDIDENHGESKRKLVRIRAARLDDLLKDVSPGFVEDIAFVWIDVQGHEGYAFMGARELLSRDIPVVSEFWPYGIRRAGMSQSEFVDIAKSIWSNYWLLRTKDGIEKFVQYPIDSLNDLFDELGYDDDAKHNKGCNVIYTR